MSLIEFNPPPLLAKRRQALKRAALIAAVVAFGLWCRSCGYDAGARYKQVDLSIAGDALHVAERDLRWAEKALRKVADEARTYERCASRDKPEASR